MVEPNRKNMKENEWKNPDETTFSTASNVFQMNHSTICNIDRQPKYKCCIYFHLLRKALFSSQKFKNEMKNASDKKKELQMHKVKLFKNYSIEINDLKNN